MNMLCMNAECQALSLTSLTGIVCAGSAPQCMSLTNNVVAEFRCFCVDLSRWSNTAGEIGRLTLLQWTLDARPGSFTMNRSFGDLPVRLPVVASNAPSAVLVASPLSTAISLSSLPVKFQNTEPVGSKPWDPRVVAKTVAELDGVCSPMR